MKKYLATTGLAAGMVIGGAVAASAALLDFTDLDAYDVRNASEASGQFGGLYWRVTPSSTPQTYNTGADRPGPQGPLEGEGDGIGIVNDEVDTTEYLTLSFFSDAAFTTEARVTINGLYFLDLYKAADDQVDPESVTIYKGSPPPGSGALLEIMAQEVFEGYDVLGGDNAGYRFEGGLMLTGSVFSFDTGLGNDNIGKGDFSLAAVDAVSAVPLPAGVVLLGSALAGLGFARRRKG